MVKYVRPQIIIIKIGSCPYMLEKQNFENSEITFRRIFCEVLWTSSPLVFVVADYNVIVFSLYHRMQGFQETIHIG